MATFKDFANVAKMTMEDKTSHTRLDEILRVLKENKAYKQMMPTEAVKILEELSPTFVKMGADHERSKRHRSREILPNVRDSPRRCYADRLRRSTRHHERSVCSEKYR